MSKYKYLPDKNGNVTRCQARDPSHCPYHLGKDGKPLKHYDTPEEAMMAYEAEQARSHSTSGLSKKKKAESKHAGFTPGASGIDDKFVPLQYRNLSMAALEKKLNGNLDREAKEKQRINSSRTSEKVMDMEQKLGIGLSPAEPIEHMNDEILDYKRRVYQVFNGLQKEADKCDGDVKYSRSMLKKLEEAHPGADYGSNDKDDVVCDNAKAYLETRMGLLYSECGHIERMHGRETYNEDRKDLIAHENAINNLIDGMKGITGDTVPGNHIQVGAITNPDNETFSEYMTVEQRRSREQAMQDHPEYANLVNRMNGEAEKLQMVEREEEKDSWFKKDLESLKGMKPLSGTKSKEALESIVSKARPWSQPAIRRDYKAIAMSDDTGYILTETPNDDNSGMEYYIYKGKVQNGDIVMGPSLTNYDDIGTDAKVFFGFPYYMD